MELSDPTFCSLNDCDEDREQLICLPQKILKWRRRNSAIVPQQFQPELRFVRFLKGAIQLGAEFCIGARSRRLTDVGRD